MTSLDYIVIALYLGGVAWLGIVVAGRQSSTDDYFLGNRDLPWGVVCLSTVATETSALTVIGLPAVAYGGTWTFLQLTAGYLIGRIVVALLLLPRYYERRLETTYEFLGHRFGNAVRATASFTFLLTRLLADGVRLFASAIPVRIITSAAGLDIGYTDIVLILGAVTVVYTLVGGIRAVVWMDVVQLSLYLAGGLLVAGILLNKLPAGAVSAAFEAGQAKVIDWPAGISEMMTSAYVLPTAVIGGAVFSIASHGTDQLMVQRLLACRSLQDSQKALIGSAVIVMLQFLLFLFIGTLLWSHYSGASVAELGLSRADEILPAFIIDGLPPGVAGLLLAGITAAAMSTISSTVNSLASSTQFDLLQAALRVDVPEHRRLLVSRLLTLFWGGVLVVFAGLFESSESAVIELGLSIASYTYGALLGIFVLGLVRPGTRQSVAIFAFALTIVSMVTIIFGVRHGVDGWVFQWSPGADPQVAQGLRAIAWPWYPLIGSVITVVAGLLPGWLSTRWQPSS